jgi:16S rRNA (adenine1518-N6/adenine1519-N6)-dimethyltransferase
MQTISEIREILNERGLHPKHRLGQNFLHDQNQLRRLLDASEVGKSDLVLEVGPGTGTLTEALVDRGCEVITSELDTDMGDIIESRLGAKVTLIRGDCLDGARAFSAEVLEALGGRPFRLVANLPYGAASPIMSLLAAMPSCLGQFVTIQREVGDRLLARPGTRQYGPLTVFVRAFADVRSIGTLSPNCFWPAPKVESIMLGITPRKATLEVTEAELGKTIHLVFSKRRKQLGTILGRSQPMPEGIDPKRRPDSLEISEVLMLAKHLSKTGRLADDPG